MPAHGPSRRGRHHDRSLVFSAVFAVAAAAVAVLVITHQPSRAAPMTDAAGPAQLTATAAGCPRLAAATPCARPLATGYHHPAVAPRTPAARRPHHSRRTPAPAASAQPTPAAAASVTPPAGQSASLSAAAQQVLALINQARAQAGLPAYTVTAGLNTSAGRHNAVMAAGCGLSHQCPGEPALGARETAAGVHWTAAGENIGEGGPVAGTEAAIAQMAVGLTQSMLDEKPPDDGHRLNILSPAFTHIGIAVFRDSSGTVWLTQDFSN
jgi:uncharacterized protein YkwD